MTSPLETHLLETFVEVVRQGSVTAAAESLNRSQPAISHRIRTLEERFDSPLFERAGRGLELSSYGERLFDEALGILAKLEGLEERVAGAPDVIRGTVSIGTFPTVARHLMPEVIEGLLDSYDELKLSFRFASAPALVERLQTGRVDAVVFVGDVDTSELSSAELGETRLVAAMAPSMAPGSDLELEDLRERRYLSWTGPDDPTFDTARRYAARHELLGPRTPEIPQIETLRVLAANGVGYTILPGYTTLRDVEAGRLVTYPLPDFEQTIPLTYLLRENRVVSPEMQRVRERIVESMRSLLAGDGDGPTLRDAKRWSS